MVDPLRITQFNRTDYELHEFIIFSVCVAGKTAKTIAPRAQDLLHKLYTIRGHPNSLPLDVIHTFRKDVLAKKLLGAGIGCYNQKAKALNMLARLVVDGQLNLRTCTTEELEQVPHIADKTSRFFIMHSRPDQQMAALDTHILKHLRSNGIERVPLSTPRGKRYRELEIQFLKLASMAGKSPADYDLEVWKQYARS